MPSHKGWVTPAFNMAKFSGIIKSVMGQMQGLSEPDQINLIEQLTNSIALFL